MRPYLLDGAYVVVRSASRAAACTATLAWAMRPTSRTEVRDYNALHGVAIAECRGIGKMSFGKGSSDTDDLGDHGVFTHYVAAEPDA